MKAKAILALGVVLLGAALYLISSRPFREPSRAVGSEHLAVAAPPNGSEAPEAPQAPSPPGIDAREASAKLVVGGIVHAAANEALIEIRPETSRETPGDLIARATVPTGVPFEIPAVDLESAPLAIFVSARCAGHVPGEARTVVLLDARTREPRVPPVELTLVRAATLSGRVVDAHGAPVHAATMAAFPSRNGTPAKTAVDATECDAKGRFELQVGEDGDYVVVAMSPGARPANCSVEARGGTIADVPALQLEAGEQVDGRVTVTGGAPAAKAKVGAVLRSPGTLRLRIPRRDLEIAWCEGRAEWRFVTGLTDDDGRYRVSGLGWGPYEVALLGVDGGHPAVTRGGSTPDALELPSGGWEDLDEHLRVRPGLSREVRPSTQGVDFDVAIATVEFVLVPGGAPPVEARLEVAVVEGIVSIENDYPAGAALRTELIVAPGARLRVRAVAEGYEPRDVEIAAPAAGVRETHRIDLVPAPAKATLVIALEPQGLGPLPALPTAFTVYLFRAERRRDDPAAYRHLSIRNPEIVVKDLDEGTFRLEVFPGSMDQREHNFYRKAVTDVTLRAGETTHLSLPLHPGGRLRLLVHDPEGRTNVAAGCKIVGPDGQTVPANFAKFEGGGTSMSTGGLPGLAGPAEVMEPLAPGLYVVRVEPIDATLRPKTLTAEIEVGRLTVAEISLDR
ncbi:MAG TPA: carboxypeptidase-like regulatory domain-containing protein [Planctomycetota bacterium]|nr:carboxypeptidase-like regulatory domain-containing protein [Planctomycetota bacterium]